jgi:hypothetical protein
MPIERRDILPGYSISRILKGSWHLSSGHGPGIERDQAIRDMAAFVEAVSPPSTAPTTTWASSS